MNRDKPLRRRTPLKRFNPERVAKRRAEAFSRQAELCRTQPCLVCGAPPPSDPAHVMSRGAGGKDRGNVVSLCRSCHQRQHQEGWGWIKDMGINVETAAKLYERLAYGE